MKLNRRTVLCLPLAVLAVPLADLTQREVIVPKGIRFLGKYPKEVYYSPLWYKGLDPTFFTEACIQYMKDKPFRCFDVKEYTPAPLSVYAKVIEEQKELGFTEWELI